MRLEYRVRYMDHLLYQVIHAFMNPVCNGLFIVLAASIFASELGDNSFLGSLLVAGAFYGIMWVAQTIFIAVFVAKVGQDGVLTNHVLEVRDDELFESTPFNESRHFWHGIQKVVRRPGFVAVYLAQHLAHVIPNRAFPSGGERDEFVRLVRERMRPA